MSIEFLGEGPSPRDISEFYRHDAVLPEFGERYPCELIHVYQANGFVLELVLPAEATIQELLEESRRLEGEDSLRRYLGPVISEEGLIGSGIARWRQICSSGRLAKC